MLLHDAFHELTQLQWLIIRGCSKLRAFPSITHLTKLVRLDLSHCPSVDQPIFLNVKYAHLQVLDLSYTPIAYGFRELSTPNLTHLSLRGLYLTSLFHFSDLHNFQLFDLPNLEVLDLSNCEHLIKLFPLKNVPRLKQLDLSGCSRLTDLHLHAGLFDQMSCLLSLDLSWTKLKHLPSFAGLTSLRKLSLRGLELDSLENLASLSKMLVELDLAGLKIGIFQELRVAFLQSLEILNLSHTSVEKLADISELVSLKELLLADCQRLKVVPSFLQALTNLEALDLSLTDNSSTDNCQLEIETEGQTNLSFIQVPKSLRKLVLTNRSGVQKLFPKTSLANLEVLDVRGTDAADWDSKLPARGPQEIIPKPKEIHFISGFRSSPPQSFEDAPMKVKVLISHIEMKVNSSITVETDNQDFKKQHEMMQTDLKYIQGNIDRLNSSRNWESKEGLLQELMDAATYLSPVDLQTDSANFKQLRRTIVKLKLLVPPLETRDSKAQEYTEKKKKRSLFVWSKNMENAAYIVNDMKSNADLLSSYNSLSPIEKKCLLCFAIFPSNEEGDKNTSFLNSLVIKKKMLIYWWAGEGFIAPEPTPNQNTSPDAGRDEQVSTSKTVEETGKQILKVLEDKKFIEQVIKKGRRSGSCCMHPFVHSFVINRAKEYKFFDFDKKSGNLSPYFTRSQRACLLKPSDKFPSSHELWVKHIKSLENVKRFKTVKTLFNVNESMIDIKREWFSKMDNMRVLHLGICHTEGADLIEVEDQKFLEDLKRMKKLRLLSLQGMPAIIKLPNSVCQLSNLIILDLKECNYLEELPPDIGSLKCLTHLDISSCPLLFRLPKGISLLSKLEVLRRFVTTDLHAAQDSRDRNKSTLSRLSKIYGLFHHKKSEVCTLRDLLKLGELRELSLVMNISKFPDDEELNVFKKMKKLCKLKILWEQNIHTAAKVSNEEQELKDPPCINLDNLEKLELWCFPNEKAPWLNPSELKNLKRLRIVGGNLKELRGSASENKWNVATLHLKYLHKLHIQWDQLRTMFPQLMYLEMHQCEQLVDFHCDEEGVWKSES